MNSQILDIIQPKEQCSMNEEKADIREAIDSELKRVKIQNHRNYAAWYASLKPHTKRVVDVILEDDVTPGLILLAQESPDDEWDHIQFLRVIGGGNADPAVQISLTNFSLQEILFTVESFA